MANSNQSNNSIETQPFYNVMPEAVGKGIPLRKVTAAKADAVFKADSTPGISQAVAAGAGPTASTITMPKLNNGLFSFFTRKAVLIPILVIIIALAGVGTWLVSSALKDDSQSNDEPITPLETINPDVTTPGDWLARFFGTETCTTITTCGDTADPDRDGLANKEEYDKGADPNNPDSDSDGIADGDEHHIFKSDPLISRTYREGQYNDADFVKGGYDFVTDLPYTDEQLATIKNRIKERGLHQPTLTTIGTVALSLYDFRDPNAPPIDPNIDQSPQAKLDRDTQRQATIKKIGGALLKYRTDKKSFPATSDFIAMSDAIRSFNTVATNYNDPIGKDQYVYGYSAGERNLNFTLSYFSETQNQLIKYTTKDAEETEAKETAAVQNEQRMADLENIKSALLIYSAANVDSNSDKIYAFPTRDQYPNILVEKRYITSVPKDPNGNSYSYEVNDTFDSFTLKAVFQNPPKGVTGYICNELECKNY